MSIHTQADAVVASADFAEVDAFEHMLLEGDLNELFASRAFVASLALAVLAQRRRGRPNLDALATEAEGASGALLDFMGGDGLRKFLHNLVVEVAANGRANVVALAVAAAAGRRDGE